MKDQSNDPSHHEQMLLPGIFKGNRHIMRILKGILNFGRKSDKKDKTDKEDFKNSKEHMKRKIISLYL